MHHEKTKHDEKGKHMSDSFEELLKKSSELPKLGGGGDYQKDPTFWYPEPPKDGKERTEYLVRLLPPSKGEDKPVAHYYEYEWKNPKNNRWYRNKSRTSLGRNQKDPFAEFSSKKYALNQHDRGRNRRERYVCNVYIEKDPQNPENNGKVLKWRFPKQIWTIIEQAAKGSSFDDDRIEPFHFLNGAPLSVVIYMKETTNDEGKEISFPQYDLSRFLSKRPFLGGDVDRMKEVWEQQYPLAELVEDGHPNGIKSEEDLRKDVEYVLAGTPDLDLFLGNQKAIDRQTNIDNNISMLDDGPSFEPDPVRQVETTSKEEPVKVKQETAQDDDIDAIFASIQNM